MLHLPRFKKSNEVAVREATALPHDSMPPQTENGCGFLGFFEAATADLARDIELRSNVIDAWEGQSMSCATGRNAQRISLLAVPQGARLVLKLQASIPGSSYVVQNYLFKGEAGEAARWLRDASLPNRLDRLAKDLVESALDKAGEYPFG